MPPAVAEILRMAYPVRHDDHRYFSGPARWGLEARSQITVDLVRYWQSFVAPFLRARSNAISDSERGASLVEYALLVALIAIVCIAAVSLLGGNANDKFKSVASSLA